jgi:DNA-binding CsgD family transcriptional regulator/tetratricopeptide (TPR) repeat protein
MTAVLASEGPWVVQVVGPAGVGKSRVLRELAAVAEARGQLVLQARAAEFEGELPFGIVRSALDDWMGSLDPERRATLAGEDAAELAPILPSLLAPDHGPAPGPAQERHHAYRAIRELLTAISGAEPVLLVLDDVHWADPASVELLAHLLTRPPRGDVSLAMGFRPAQAPPLLEQALAAAVREHEALRLELRPLGADASATLLGGAVPPAIATALHRESGGTPYFLLALARAYVHEGRQPLAPAGGVAGVPAVVRAALAGELAALAPDELLLLQGAAVAGDPSDVRVAARAAAVEDAAVPDLVDALLASELLTATPIAGRLAFRHPTVRATVLAGAGGGWLSAAHGRVATHLAARGADLAARAPHVERSALPGDEHAVALLRDAGNASLQQAPALAARWFAAAADLVPDTPDATPARIALRLAEASAATGAGQLDRGHAALGAVLELLPVDAPDRVPVVAGSAGIEHLLGRHRDARARLAAARAAADPESVGAVLLEVELAACAGYETRPAEMLDCARAGLARADHLGLRALGAVAAGQVALAHYFLGQPADGALAVAARRFADLTDAELSTRLDLGLWLGWTEAVLERHDGALATTDRVLRVSRDAGHGATLLVTQTAATWSLLRLGRLDRAEATIGAAIETGRLAPNLFLSVSVGQLGLLRLAQGRLTEAVQAGEESVRLAGGADPGLVPGMSGFYAAAPLLEAGRPADATRVLLAMSGGDPALRTSRSGLVPAYEVLTRAALATGDLEAASDWAARAQGAARDAALPAEDAHAQRALAELALARGDAGGAADRALAAAARSAGAGLPIDAGRCETLAGRALAAGGHRDDAIAVLERAADRLAAVGADGWAAGPQSELRRLGRRGRRRREAAADSGPEGLTEREAQVAELVRSGQTNRQIAEHLYVSEKTIERILSSTFGKLGVRNRTALAARLAVEREPAGPTLQ